MVYECCCADLSLDQWKERMKGIKPISYKWLVAKVKKHLPQLYESLMLDFYNPYENKCGVTKEYYILCHSSIEYFIKK
ncbi:hypothetical protein CIK99_14195 [Prevotella sp. P5-92]|nr:hypothetical protein CIK99_14195 [Prevotella sp. P5-92]